MKLFYTIERILMYIVSHIIALTISNPYLSECLYSPFTEEKKRCSISKPCGGSLGVKRIYESFLLFEESLNSDSQQFHHQQNEQPPLTSNH